MKFTFMRLYASLSGLALIVAFLASCQPYMTYEELEEGAESDPKIQKRLERFERDAERAGVFMEQRYYCSSSGNCTMFCVWHGPRIDADRVKFDDLDDMVRWYRRVRHACQFVKRP